MAEQSALAAYKAGQKESKGNKKKTNTFYFPIGRTLTTIGGVLQMVNPQKVMDGINALWDWDLPKAANRLAGIFQGGDYKGGAKTIATGIVLGKALDHTKVNPRVKMGKYGIKLV